MIINGDELGEILDEIVNRLTDLEQKFRRMEGEMYPAMDARIRHNGVDLCLDSANLDVNDD